MPHVLYRYRCSFCKTVAASTIQMTDPPLKCALCLRIMAFLFSTPISAEEWAERHRHPPVFTSPYEIAPVAPEDREQKCSRLACHVWKPKRELLNGRFCSEACGAADSADLAAVLDRVEKLYQDNPWLRPKEVIHG